MRHTLCKENKVALGQELGAMANLDLRIGSTGNYWPYGGGIRINGMYRVMHARKTLL